VCSEENPPPTLFRQAQKIFQTFIVFNAPYEINISFALRNSIGLFFDSKDSVNASKQTLFVVFDVAATEINTLLRSDAWPRFLTSELYLYFRTQQKTGMSAHSIALFDHNSQLDPTLDLTTPGSPFSYVNT